MDSKKKTRIAFLVIILIELAVIAVLATIYVMGTTAGKTSAVDEYNKEYSKTVSAASAGTVPDTGSKTQKAETAGTAAVPKNNVTTNNNAAYAGKTAAASASAAAYSAYTLGVVDESYFNDALFIGDSRTVGLRGYGGFPESGFFCKTGISTNALFDAPAQDEETGLTLTETLTSGRTYKKIYIMLGVNDLGYGTLKTFMDEFTSAIAKIQTFQPDAIIYVESIIGVTKYKEAGDPDKFSQERINERNAALEAMCNGRNLIYLDVASVVKDSEGYLNYEFSADGLHLGSDYYYLWEDYLMNHAAIPEQ